MPITYHIDSQPHKKALVAIIDIGSNSVRMVVYHALKRVPLPVFNEKYMCALGKGMAHTGKLNEDGVVLAKSAIARFLLMARRLGVKKVDILATAAIRDAKDGVAFVKALEKEHHTTINVISGEEEARYAAMGIMASIHAPLGLSADLGGGSLELAAIAPSHVSDVISLPIGSLLLSDRYGDNIQKMQAAIRQELKQVPWLKELDPPSIYAIGGGFRTLAKIHMKARKYPLNLTHEYEVPRAEILAVVEQILETKKQALSKLPGLPERRVPTIVPTAIMLKVLLEETGADSVITSVSGIREGFFHSELVDQQKHDPLIASATDLAALTGKHDAYAKELFAWMAALFTHEPLAFTRVRRAACSLSEIAWSIDPNFRAEWAYTRVIQSSLKGLSHPERVMLALALYHRYRTNVKQKLPGLNLLDEYETLWARYVGLAMNLAFQLSGGKAGNLNHAILQMRDYKPFLWIDEEASPLRTEMVEKRLEGLGKTCKALSSASK